MTIWTQGPHAGHGSPAVLLAAGLGVVVGLIAGGLLHCEKDLRYPPMLGGHFFLFAAGLLLAPTGANAAEVTLALVLGGLWGFTGGVLIGKASRRCATDSAPADLVM